jgi:hypothetical protein
MTRVTTNQTRRAQWAAVAALSVAMATGCSQGTPGGPGAKGKAPAYGQAADTFNLSVPMMASSLQQGGTSNVVVGIVRGMNFDEDVALKFADLPLGVTVEPASPGIKRGETNANVAFRAGTETPVGAFKVNVTGHPTKGGDAQADFKLDILAKDGFSVSLPRSATPLVQGGTRSVEISVDRQKAFAEAVSIQFGEFPTGVTAEPSEPVIEKGKSTTRVVLSATDDAALGDFTVRVVGHPTQGDDASSDLRLNIVRK